MSVLLKTKDVHKGERGRKK